MEVLLDKIKKGYIYECVMPLQSVDKVDVRIYPVTTNHNGHSPLKLGSTPVFFCDGTLYKIWVFVGGPVWKGKQYVVDMKTLENMWQDTENDSMFAARCVAMAKFQFPVWGEKVPYREILKDAMNEKFEWGLA